MALMLWFAKVGGIALTEIVQVQAAVAAHGREVESFLTIMETQQPSSVERQTSEAVLDKMATQFGMGLRQLFGGSTTEAQRDELSKIVQAVPVQLAKARALTLGSQSIGPTSVTAWQHQGVVKRHFRVALSVLYGWDPYHLSVCWRCWQSGYRTRVYALEEDRCAICTWVICPKCGAGSFGCPRCTYGLPYTPQSLAVKLA